MHPTERLKAITSGELMKVMMGEDPGFFKPNPYGDVPVDEEWIMDFIKNLHAETNDKRILRVLNETMLNMQLYPESYWFSLYYLLHILAYKDYKDVSLINIDEFVFRYKLQFEKHAAYLHDCRKWVGKQYEDGLYGDLIRKINAFKEMQNIDLLP